MTRKGNSDLVDLELQLHHETPAAILVSDDGERERAKWLPKAQCEVERRPRGIVLVTLSERLAIDKGFV